MDFLFELSWVQPHPPLLVAEFFEILTIELSINSITFRPDYSAMTRFFDFSNVLFEWFNFWMRSRTLFLTPIGKFNSMRSSLLSIAKSFSVKMWLLTNICSYLLISMSEKLLSSKIYFTMLFFWGLWHNCWSLIDVYISFLKWKEIDPGLRIVFPKEQISCYC